ncbi:hypothetical protein RvY_10922-1 [Ramazzottius varieornatus]|uniref:Uncharacterized protein n=1 Tax=Ramazzottius varieornatus TaxID=947166 RepID=A0A1D1VGE7_RAMVA|nr:hypothetical protein RvY_10922-1 [Ramazzottius varieornatus]
MGPHSSSRHGRTLGLPGHPGVQSTVSASLLSTIVFRCGFPGRGDRCSSTLPTSTVGLSSSKSLFRPLSTPQKKFTEIRRLVSRTLWTAKACDFDEMLHLDIDNSRHFVLSCQEVQIFPEAHLLFALPCILAVQFT